MKRRDKRIPLRMDGFRHWGSPTGRKWRKHWRSFYYNAKRFLGATGCDVSIRGGGTTFVSLFWNRRSISRVDVSSFGKKSFLMGCISRDSFRISQEVVTPEDSLPRLLKTGYFCESFENANSERDARIASLILRAFDAYSFKAYREWVRNY